MALVLTNNPMQDWHTSTCQVVYGYVADAGCWHSMSHCQQHSQRTVLQAASVALPEPCDSH
jgi:hypothetical protein